MRISTAQQIQITQLVHKLLNHDVDIRVFGSRLDNDAKGGDLDLFVRSPHALEKPAFISAQIAAKVSRLLHGRKVDILLQAPNLKITPIHRIAQQGQLIR